MLEDLSLSRYTRGIIDRRRGVNIYIEGIYLFGNLDCFILRNDRSYSFLISLSHIRLDYRHGYYLFSLF